jgi:hypothetical protein
MSWCDCNHTNALDLSADVRPKGAGVRSLTLLSMLGPGSCLSQGEDREDRLAHSQA